MTRFTLNLIVFTILLVAIAFAAESKYFSTVGIDNRLVASHRVADTSSFVGAAFYKAVSIPGVASSDYYVVQQFGDTAASATIATAKTDSLIVVRKKGGASDAHFVYFRIVHK